MIWTGQAGALEVTAGRAGVIQAGREFLQGPGLLRGPGVHLQGREDIPAGLESLLSFFVILFMLFDDL